jgi:hypothetical protein
MVIPSIRWLRRIVIAVVAVIPIVWAIWRLWTRLAPPCHGNRICGRSE